MDATATFQTRSALVRGGAGCKHLYNFVGDKPLRTGKRAKKPEESNCSLVLGMVALTLEILLAVRDTRLGVGVVKYL